LAESRKRRPFEFGIPTSWPEASSRLYSSQVLAVFFLFKSWLMGPQSALALQHLVLPQLFVAVLTFRLTKLTLAAANDVTFKFIAAFMAALCLFNLDYCAAGHFYLLLSSCLASSHGRPGLRR
jgi:hypothetical protein